MSFIQPLLLFALPLVALPVLIHLISQHRHRTVRWAAMMFLLDAKRSSRGLARLRHMLILLARMLAVAALIVAVSRPLANGWRGLLGGAPNTTIVLLDRSASMEQQDLQTGESKRSTALRKLAGLLQNAGAAPRIVLIDSATNRAQEIQSPNDLLDLPDTAATATAADIPALLQTAQDYIAANQTGRTDLWICSDLRTNDWEPESGRWEALTHGFTQLPGVRINLLSYAQPPEANLAVRVGRAECRKAGAGAELVLDVNVHCEPAARPSQEVPLAFVVNGVRSIVNVTLQEGGFSLQGHTIPLDGRATSGWGRVELPADANAADNVFYFVYGDPPVRRTVIVSDEPNVVEPLRVAAGTPVARGLPYAVDIVPSAQASEIPWDTTALLVWQAPLPEGVVASQLANFVASGRTVLFFAPSHPNTGELYGVKWGRWREPINGQHEQQVDWWRGDSDLLEVTQNGSSLPVGDLKTYRYCSLEGGANPLAKFADGSPLLARVPTDQGGVYFCSTLPHANDSSLARDGVVLYVMLQRAMSRALAVLGSARQVTAGAGALSENLAWQAVDTSQPPVSPSDRSLRAGAYRAGDQLVALNRPAAEDLAAVVSDDAVDRIFSGLDYHRIDDDVHNTSSLASEIWRSFLVCMALALIAEAALCLQPKRPARDASPTGLFRKVPA